MHEHVKEQNTLSNTVQNEVFTIWTLSSIVRPRATTMIVTMTLHAEAVLGFRNHQKKREQFRVQVFFLEAFSVCECQEHFPRVGCHPQTYHGDIEVYLCRRLRILTVY